MDRQQQMDLLSGSEMKRFTASTITDPEVLINELDKVAQKGYAIDNQEHDAGVIEIAAPVFDSCGIVIGALSILGPEMRFASSRIEIELLPLVCKSASQLSNVFGHIKDKETPAEIILLTPKAKLKTRKFETKPYVLGRLKTC
jgi:DNA-binding IclR family transcriptional regulator